MKYTHVTRPIENNIIFAKKYLPYIWAWEQKNGEIVIDDYRTDQCKGGVCVTLTQNGETVKKTFNRSSDLKNYILNIVGAPGKRIQPGGTGGW